MRSNTLQTARGAKRPFSSAQPKSSQGASPYKNVNTATAVADVVEITGPARHYAPVPIRSLVVADQKKSRTISILSLGIAAVLVLAGLWLLNRGTAKTSAGVVPAIETAATAEAPAPVTIKKKKSVSPVAVSDANNGDEATANVRQNWRRYLTVSNSSYGYGVLGGINDLTLTFKNRSGYPVEEMVAKVVYIKANGKPWKTQLVPIQNVGPHAERKITLSKVNRGKSVRINIVKVTSRKMRLSYSEA